MEKRVNELLKFLKIVVLESRLEDIQSTNEKDRGKGDRVEYATHTGLMLKESER